MATVLVVEDEVTILALAESILQGAGYDTVTAASLTEADAILGSDKTIDLIFTDITLADIADGGIEVGQHSRSRNVPVLYTSGRAVTDGMQELFVERSAFLPKPYTNEELLDAVSRLLKS